MSQIAQITQARDNLLLSHANPEDNEFTLRDLQAILPIPIKD